MKNIYFNNINFIYKIWRMIINSYNNQIKKKN